MAEMAAKREGLQRNPEKVINQSVLINLDKKVGILTERQTKDESSRTENYGMSNHSHKNTDREEPSFTLTVSAGRSQSEHQLLGYVQEKC